MRTKALLLAAAALAAGIFTSQAQTVYSANIVGYVNTPLNSGYAAVANPLDNAAGNALTNIIPNSGSLDGMLVYTWNGSSYTIYTLDSTQPTGVGDSADLNPVLAPVINPGTLFYFDNNTASNYTNTFVGTVHVEGTGTGSVGVTTNTLAPGYSFVASKVPVSGGVSSVLGLTNTAGALDGTLLYIPNINASGQFLGYNIVTFDSTQPTGFGDSADLNPVAEPAVNAGTGFIFFNNTSSTFQWAQSF